MAGSFAGGTAAGGKNFVIQKSEKGDQLKTLTVSFCFSWKYMIIRLNESEIESVEINSIMLLFWNIFFFLEIY